MKKRIISLLLAFLLTMDALPWAALASDIPSDTEAVCESCAEAVCVCPAEETPAAEVLPEETEPAESTEVTEPAEVTKPLDATEASEASKEDSAPEEETTAAETEYVDHCPYCEDTLAEDGTVVHEAFCTAAYAYDGTSDVGKYVQLIAGVGGIEAAASPNLDEVLLYYYDEFAEGTIMRIADWYWDPGTTALWYQVELYSGAFPEAVEDVTWPDPSWILQTYTDPASDYGLTLEFVTVEEPADHCEICGNQGCTSLHFYCSICQGYDCGLAHLYCSSCAAYDCTLTHVWCGSCGVYDCGITHENSYVPPVEPILPESPVRVEGAEVTIVDEEGNPVHQDGLMLRDGVRVSLSAWSDLEEGAAYRWQIRYDAVNDLWVDIRGQTGKGILISAALFRSVLLDQGSAAIRCIVSAQNQTRVSPAISMGILEKEAAFAAKRSSSVSALAEGAPSDQLQKSYVVVQYVYADGRTAAATTVAEISRGAAYSYQTGLPKIAGYLAQLETHSYGDAVQINAANELVMNFAEGVLTEDSALFTVTYVPDFVPVTVIHYWQNLDNDSYTEYSRQTIDTVYKTGEVIENAHNTYEGLYHLLYEKPAAAADGSTVIEIFYDRGYYLMKFELGEMGYGVDPIYARYGAPVEIGTPVRAGYTFQGWALNGEAAEVPATMPGQHRTYVAQWKTNDLAKVSVVFWGENPDDEGYSYDHTGILEVAPGTEFTYAGGNSTFLICGETTHSHGASCVGSMTCTIEPHTHSEECCEKETGHTHSVSCYNNVGNKNNNNTNISSAPSNPVDGTIYRRGWRYSRVIYISGTWYLYNGNESSGTIIQPNNSCPGVHTHGDGNCQCTKQEHSHDDSCYTYSCGLTEHSHVNACYQTGSGMDSDLWTYVKSDTVTVEADGSTVLNVYYDRTTFTLTFRANSSTVATITDKWGAEISDEFGKAPFNTTYNGRAWQCTDSSKFSEALQTLDIMPQFNATFNLYNKSSDTLKTIYYYVQKPGTNVSANSWPTSNENFILLKEVGTYFNYATYEEEYHEIEGFTRYSKSVSGFSNNQKNFTNNKLDLYYLRKSYNLEFNNGEEVVKTETIQHGLSLEQYEEFIPEAPSLYEPGSVQFEGWYLNPECTGDSVDLSSYKMPASNLILYAKWVPTQYPVRFYLSRNSYGNGEDIPAEMNRLIAAAPDTPSEEFPYDIFAAQTVGHGSYITNLPDPMVAGGYEDIHPWTGYDFIGWFYLNEEGEETAFDPDNMPVTQELHLYAKWSAKNKLCKYHFYFALDSDGDGIADKDAEGNLIYVADPVSSSGIPGNTYTQPARGGADLYTGYQEGYFPLVGSHSITVDIKDEEGTDTNFFIFVYQQKDAVPYTVKYVDKDTGTELMPDKTVDDNKNVVVTENYEHISGYMPDAYQKTLVITPSGENVITFWYTKDELHALYVVNHYVQQLDESLNHAGWAKYSSLQNTGDIGTTYSAEQIVIPGFTLSTDYTDRYNVTEMQNPVRNTPLPSAVEALTDGHISGELTEQGMELNFYYTRNLYPYEFRYMLSGTATALADPVFGKAGFDTVVVGASQEIVADLDGDGVLEDYRLYDPLENRKQITIKEDGPALSADFQVTANQATINIATFYYVRSTQSMTITKLVVDNGVYSHPDPDQVFEFTLRIHSKSNFHKSSYEYTKSDGSAGTLSPEYVAPDTLRFSLKDGEHITILDLPTAEYTLSEQNLPLGYYDTYDPEKQENGRYKLTVEGELSAEVTNTYAPTVLEITKTVEIVEDQNRPEVEDFVFTITVPDGVFGNYTYVRSGTQDVQTASVTDGKMTVSLKNGQSARFENLPLGRYVVEETDYSAMGYKSSISLNDAEHPQGRSATVTFTQGGLQKVDFLNRYPVGDLNIQKTVTKEYGATPWEGDSFTFTVERTTEGRPLAAGNSYDVYEGETKIGTLTVSEDHELELEISFTEDFTAPEDAPTRTLTIRNLPAGEYAVTEAEKTGYIQSATLVTDLQIPAEDTPTAAFTNELIRPEGSLYLEKLLEKAQGYVGELDMDMEFSFRIELLEQPPEQAEIQVAYDGGTATTVQMENGAFEVTLKAQHNVTISGLPIGTYRITEVSIPRYANSFAKKVEEKWVPMEGEMNSSGSLYVDIPVEKESLSEVQCTNVFPVDKTSLTIERRNASDDQQVFVYQITNEDASISCTVTVAGNASTTIYDLPNGTYTVTQLNDWSWRYSDGSQTIALLSGNSGKVVFDQEATQNKWLDGNSNLLVNRKGGT